MDKELAEKIKESREERGFSVEGFSRREFVIMMVICQKALADDELRESVNPFTEFKGLDLELDALLEKINDFIDLD